MGFRERHAIADLGVGVGFRRPHVAGILRERPPMDWFEIVSENYFAEGGIQRANLEVLRAGYRCRAPRCVALDRRERPASIADYLERLASLVRRVDAPWCSDHLCWTGIAGARRARPAAPALHGRDARARRRTRQASAGCSGSPFRAGERVVVHGVPREHDARAPSSSRRSRSAQTAASFSTSTTCT